MNQNQTDIIILGAGVVGLIAALLAARAGFSVCVIDKSAPPKSIKYLPMQARTIAINPSNMQLLDDLGLWHWLIRSRLGLINHMTIVDTNKDELSFGEKDSAALATVIEYAHLQWALFQACEQQPQVHLHNQVVADRVFMDADQITLTLDNHASYAADLIIGADGAKSWLCEHAGFELEKRPYHHSACIGLASSEKGQGDAALQTFSHNSIVGVLPLNNNDQHSVIFSCTDKEKDKLLKSNAAMQDCILTNVTNHRLGMMHWQTPIKAIPLVERHLKHYVKPHMAIIGDAAHRIHPMAGQGANLGFADAIALIEALKLAKVKRKSIGSLAVLKNYELQQKSKNTCMLSLHDMLKETFADNATLVSQLRGLGLRALDTMPWVKSMMQEAIS